MKHNSIIDQLIFDPDTGSLKYKDVRYLLIRPETLVGFQKTIENHSRKTAREALFQGGYRGGYLSAQKYKETQNLSDKETIQFMMTMGAEIGWGQFKLVEYDFENRKLQIRVKNSAFAESYGESAEGVCHLIRGVLSGLASFLFSQDCKATETECLAKGDRHCAFYITEKSGS